MSLLATQWAWQQKNLRPLHKLVLLRLADRINEERQKLGDYSMWPSYDQMMEDTGVDRKTLWQAISALKGAGLLRDTGRRVGRTNQITVFELVLKTQAIDTSEQFRKGNDSENGTVPNFPSNSSENGTGNSSENGIRNLEDESIRNQEDKTASLDGKKKKGKAPGKKISLAEFMAACKAEGIKTIPDDDPVWDFADKAGIDDEMIVVAWQEFMARHLDKLEKKYTNWRQTFQNSVRGNWYSIWFLKEGQPASWTTVGEGLRRAAA